MTIKEALKLFEKLGMHIREGRDTIASFYHEGKLIIRTNENELEELRECKIYKEDYVELLKNKGKL